MSHDYMYKIVLCGHSSTGKSSLLRRFTDDVFEDSYLATIGVDFKFKTTEMKNGKKAKLQIWDTAGQQKFRTITSAYYKGAHGVVFVYDVTAAKTLEDIQQFWLAEIEKYGEKNVRKIVLANKSDLIDQPQKNKAIEMLTQFQQKHSINFYVVSAKTGENVNEGFYQITQHCIKQYGASNRDQAKHGKSVIDDIRKKRAEFELKSAKESQFNKKKCC